MSQVDTKKKILRRRNAGNNEFLVFLTSYNLYSSDKNYLFSKYTNFVDITFCKALLSTYGNDIQFTTVYLSDITAGKYRLQNVQLNYTDFAEPCLNLVNHNGGIMSYSGVVLEQVNENVISGWRRIVQNDQKYYIGSV